MTTKRGRYMSCVTRKCPLRGGVQSFGTKDSFTPSPLFLSLVPIFPKHLIQSVSYPKKDWRGPARQSFFGYDNDKDLKAHFLVTQLTCKYDQINTSLSCVIEWDEWIPYKTCLITILLKWQFVSDLLINVYSKSEVAVGSNDDFLSILLCFLIPT